MIVIAAKVAGGGAEDPALLVDRERSGGEVWPGRLLAAQVPSVGEKVKGSDPGPRQQPIVARFP
jgi:hypothetical protein